MHGERMSELLYLCNRGHLGYMKKGGVGFIGRVHLFSTIVRTTIFLRYSHDFWIQSLLDENVYISFIY